jgi:hypothetical protein
MEIESFLGPMKWHRADRRVPVGAQKSSRFPSAPAFPPLQLPSTGAQTEPYTDNFWILLQ